jgi:hypothetical protein
VQNRAYGWGGGLAIQISDATWAHETQSDRRVAALCRKDQMHSPLSNAVDSLQKFQKSVVDTD